MLLKLHSHQKIGLFLLVLALVAYGTEAFAQSSLGIGRSQQAIPPDGLFAGILFKIQQEQQAFYKSMVSVLRTMKTDGTQVWGLAALSFGYGVFHAAGPGHGKAVISSYMLANEVAARRGIYLSFASAMLQGVTAILVISALLLFLRGTGIRSDNLTGYLEIASYFCVMVLGAYLIWTKVFKKSSSHAHNHDHDHNHSHHSHNHVHTDDCGCGHSHAPDPKMLEGKMGVREAWYAIMAVGLRPCTGAIIVLTFAFLNGLYVGGILSTFAMSLGTGITVATLALLAVATKNTAIKIAGLQDRVSGIHRGIEILGAVFVFLIGLLLFSAAITV